MTLFTGNARGGNSSGNSRITSDAIVQLSNTDDYVEIVRTAATTVKAPPAPFAGQTFTIKDGGFNSSTYPITFNFAIDGTTNSTLATDGGSKTICWNGSAWRAVQTSGGSASSGLPNGFKTAILGDSITANNSSNTTVKSLINNGYWAWFRILMRGAVNFSPANNYGVSGDTIQQISARTASVISSGAKLCCVHAGTNNLLTADSFATMKSAMLTGILRPLLNAGIVTVVIPILPRSGITTAQQQKRSQFNCWLRELASGNPTVLAAAGFPAGANIILSDPCSQMQDASGVPLTSDFADGLHPSQGGAYKMGKKLVEDIGYLFSSQFNAINEYYDFYDATNNPTGNLVTNGTVNYGLCSGTGGTLTTATSLTPTGVVADGLRIFRGVGTSTATLVGSKENPRSDTMNGLGERQIVTATSTSSGSSAESFTFTTLSTIGNVSAGDTVFAECSYEIAPGMRNVRGMQLWLVENGGSSQQSLDGAFATTGFVLEPHNGVLRTPLITLGTGVTNLNCYMQVVLDTTAGATGGFAQVYWGDFKVLKVGVY